MKRLLMILSFLLMMLISYWAQAADIPLKATWTPNVEPDVKEYELFRLDVMPILSIGKIPHPPVLPYLFTITVPDGTEGTARFYLKAIDTAGNQSEPSSEAGYFFDYKSPAAPKNLGVQK